MPSQIWECLAGGGCSARTLWSSLADLIVPLFFDFLIFTLVAERVLSRIEERKWLSAKRLVFARLSRVLDRLLMDVVPSSLRAPYGVATIAVGDRGRMFRWRGGEVPTNLVAAVAAELPIRLRTVVSAIGHAREASTVLPGSLVGHIGDELITALIEFDEQLQISEEASQGLLASTEERLLGYASEQLVSLILLADELANQLLRG